MQYVIEVRGGFLRTRIGVGLGQLQNLRCHCTILERTVGPSRGDPNRRSQYIIE
jgi:hypothetical protein